MADWKDVSLDVTPQSDSPSQREGETAEKSSSSALLDERPSGDLIIPVDGHDESPVDDSPSDDVPASPGPAASVMDDDPPQRAMSLHALMRGDAVPQADAAKPAAGEAFVSTISDEEYLLTMSPQTIAPLAMIGGGLSALLLLVSAMIATHQSGNLVAGIFAAAGSGFVLVITIGLTFLAAKVVSLIFQHDFGNFGELLCKVAAVCAAYELALIFIALALHPLFALFLGLPVLLVLAIWLLGMDGFQAFVFAIITSTIKFLLMMLVVGALLGAAVTAFSN